MIRPYNTQDKDNLLGLLRLNIPQYFHASEEDDYKQYLENYLDSYYVVEVNDVIVGAGGINYLTENAEARLSWDVIHPQHQGRGIGRKLTIFRIEEIKRRASVKTICVRTTQLVHGFYEKLGFKLENTQKDYWAEGFDLYLMKMPV